jgi:hypothetical protein
MKRCARLPPCCDAANEGCERREAPNQRLKLTAPGLGTNCVCAPAGSMPISTLAAPC